MLASLVKTRLNKFTLNITKIEFMLMGFRKMLTGMLTAALLLGRVVPLVEHFISLAV